jgi:imidazoleglycerol-phosphate dehydratase
LAEEFWRAVSSSGKLTLHVVLHHGRNTHHVVETIFKACARALRVACEPDPRAGGAIPSTKGVL